MIKERIAQIALLLTPQIGPVKSKELIQYYGSARAIFNEKSSAELLKVCKLSTNTIQDLLQKKYHGAAVKEWELCKQTGIELTSIQDDNYPLRLRNSIYAPLLLYKKGNVDLNCSKVIAIAGSRTPTERGKHICQSLIKVLRPYNVLVVSGLAYGIDITAHKSCLEYGVPTLGVVGHSLDRIYPAIHERTASKMLQNGGLLSEHPMGTGVHARHFPMRNRIIAGLADVLVVIETKTKGGSMITADYTHQLQRRCYAIPGRQTDTLSEGCNQLIQKNKATLLQCTEELPELLKWHKKKPGKQTTLFTELTDSEQAITKVLTGQDALHLEQLIQILDTDSSTLICTLLELELKGYIKALPGKYFSLI